MLNGRRGFASFAVNDITAARAFYGETLGLGLQRAIPNEAAPLWLEVGGDRGILMYEKRDHVAAGFTVLNFGVEGISGIVDELTRRGVTIERYPGFDTDERGIHHSKGHSIAWFKDPAGNGLSVVEETSA